MTLWIAVLAACLVSYLLKLSGHLVPQRVLERRAVAQISPLLPVALLSSLVVTQALLTDVGTLTLDARAAGVGVAVAALLLRAPFLVVVVLAALTAALIRLFTG
ncbi:MAG: AzlD domain-containing protein [Actinobacteria bacterium]|nr:AzlD domain-containing protein [Actinomycetota bacterium]